MLATVAELALDPQSLLRALAQIMRTGRFRQVHVKSRQCLLWRSLLVARRTVMNEMRSIENVLRALLRESGIKLGTPSRADFASPLAEYRKIIDEILQRMPEKYRYPRPAAEAVRSFLMLRLGMHLGLRQKNLRQLLIWPSRPEAAILANSKNR